MCDIRKIENIFFGGRKLLYVTTMCEVQMLCCWILLHKNNEFLMYLVNSSEAKLITLWWLPLLTLLWTTQNYLWYYPLYCNACCTTTTIPWNQDLENKPDISPDPPLYIIKSDEKKLLFFCIPIYTYYIQISFYTIYLHSYFRVPTVRLLKKVQFLKLKEQFFGTWKKICVWFFFSQTLCTTAQ